MFQWYRYLKISYPRDKWINAWKCFWFWCIISSGSRAFWNHCKYFGRCWWNLHFPLSIHHHLMSVPKILPLLITVGVHGAETVILLQLAPPDTFLKREMKVFISSSSRSWSAFKNFLLTYSEAIAQSTVRVIRWLHFKMYKSMTNIIIPGFFGGNFIDLDDSMFAILLINFRLQICIFFQNISCNSSYLIESLFNNLRPSE